MSMIVCPECGKQISSSAESCPNCGYVITKREPPNVRRSELSEKKTNAVMGAIYIVCGLAAVIGGIFTLAIIIGIFALIGGVAFIGLGVAQLKGVQSGKCPYCENSITVRADAATFKCPHCKKTSTKDGNTLKTID